MLIFRYLSTEVFKSQLAVFLTLMTIFVSQKFVSILADAAEGSIPGQLVLQMVMLKLPQLASLILPLSIFLGIILAYSRIYADSEMTVLKACGVSEWYVVRLTLISSTLLAILAGFLTLKLAPWANEHEYQLKEKIEADAGLAALRSGRFQQTDNEKAVVFIHDINQGGTELDRVFYAQIDRDSEMRTSEVVYAEKGKVLEDDNTGEQKLILSDGKRYENPAGSKQLQLTEFKNYEVQIQDQAIEQKRRKLEALPSMQLLEQGTKEAIAQFQWRLAVPLSIPLLTLIAVPLSVVNPRQGKFAKLVPAISLYLGYFVLLNAGTFLVQDGKIPTSIGLWWIHLSALFIGTFLILRDRPLGSTIRAWFSKKEATV